MSIIHNYTASSNILLHLSGKQVILEAENKQRSVFMSVVHITKDTFESIVNQNDKPVLIDFWAPWCGPCQMVGPIIEEIAAERDDIIVGKINVDDEMELAKSFRIVSIPTIILMKNGEKVATSIGYKPKEEILKIL